MGVQPEAEEAAMSCALRCGLSSVRILMEALSCVHSSAHRAEEVTVSASSSGEGGLRFTVEDFGCLQICALLGRESFPSFHCRDEHVSLTVNLNQLFDCLNVSSGVWDRSVVPLQIEYEGGGSPLVLTMQDKDVTVRSEIVTIEATALTDFRFLSSNVLSSVILQSESLRDALTELDFGGASIAELRISPTDPKVSLHCSSNVGAACDIVFPDPESHAPLFVAFQSQKKQTSFYKLNFLRRSFKGLSLSKSTRLRMNSDGMLSLVMSIRFPGASTKYSCFLECLIVAEEIRESDMGSSSSMDG
ncbi:hypothetical protein NDN08_005379 [Rhodosorus marinus]|uniref:Cell cycle checkpoint protein RAD1 n=1 Tax=Rhodosorus marinus TaxID=101924 RepID=A0AAV8V1G6_9RHOD|nr:hypothetical protein NDN08_005379 [Rhodosorus marinus]